MVREHFICCDTDHDKWVPVTAAWHIHRIQINSLQIRGVAANILNKQLKAADEGLSSSLGVGQGV